VLVNLGRHGARTFLLVGFRRYDLQPYEEKKKSVQLYDVDKGMLGFAHTSSFGIKVPHKLHGEAVS